jgi:hypothetical protein
VKFLCGRPGCGKESTATLQIDAPSETVSLVDPRISRDGVPLCARHADATTPPVGWTMNDLRSRNRALAAVPDEGTVPTSTPPRVRPEPASAATPDPLAPPQTAGQRDTRMSRRQSIEERARRTAETDPVGPDDQRFRSSRPPAAAAGSVDADPGRPTTPTTPTTPSRRSEAGPESRPTRRRDVPDEVAVAEEDRFPWHYQYQDDEPEEMQASSPLLSRAFRSSTG